MEPAGVERNAVGLLCVRLIGFYGFLLVIPDSNEFICSASDDQGFPDANVHAVNDPRMERKADLLELLLLL